MSLSLPIYPYIEYLCGSFKDCKAVDQSERQKLKALEITKHRVLSDFHFVGLKEHMEWSIVLLEFIPGPEITNFPKF